jgi:hypothetical protein
MRERGECAAPAAVSPRCQEALTLRTLEDRPVQDVRRPLAIRDRMAKIYGVRALGVAAGNARARRAQLHVLRLFGSPLDGTPDTGIALSGHGRFLDSLRYRQAAHSMSNAQTRWVFCSRRFST